ncbi:hypothetical protein F4553_005793 [Allocatelliglobosispora scoriae]|uniref:Uncharacterized protein n=1 Tax=Allocatelliglobosispora scoriae TaxID=643052 RepID=A0A841BZ32_9ACTN|nr:hypothetical protein [Allocatelliglobosispora scoriae]MBB5872359.1 hypothetical protein [Allocatelliglobosispora scoriae]
MVLLLRRLLSPTGFVLIGLCFLLPFVTASCSAGPETGAPVGESVEISGTYTGTDLLLGGAPDMRYPDTRVQGETKEIVDDDATSSPMNGAIDPLPAQKGAAVTVGLLVLGLIAGVLPWARLRHRLTALAALLAALALVLTEVRAASLIEETALRSVGAAPGDSGIDMIFRYGFWLALGLLIVVAVGNIISSFRDGARAVEPDEPGELGPVLEGA